MGAVKLCCSKESNDSADTMILGAVGCETLNLVQCVNVNSTGGKSLKLGNLTKVDIISEYQDIFTGIGEYEWEYHIETRNDVTPVIQPACRIPYAREENIESHIAKTGNVAPMDQATD